MQHLNIPHTRDRITHISYTVRVRIKLTRIAIRRAVVTDISTPIIVCIFLVLQALTIC